MIFHDSELSKFGSKTKLKFPEISDENSVIPGNCWDGGFPGIP